MNLDKFRTWARTHKKAIVGIAVGMGVVIIGGIVIMLFVSLGRVRQPAKHPTYLRFSTSEMAPSGIPSREVKNVAPLQIPEIEVKEGSMEIKSKDAEADFDKLKSMTDAQQGYIERSTRSITNLYISISATLRVPPKNFLGLIENLKEEFKVKSYNIKNYRIAVERELDELEILRKSLGDYEDIRGEIKKMTVSEEKINLLMKVTDKELELKRKERGFQRELSAKERRGEYATLYVTLKQQKSPKIWPENILNRFKDRVKRAFEKVTTILIDLVGGGIELFFRVIQIVIYLFIIGIVLAGAYKIVQILYRKYWKE